MQAISTKGLTKKYNDKTALADFTVDIPENKIVGLIGRNGAGKTTFLKTCAGRIRQTDGEIRIFGESVFDNLDVLSRIIFVDEESQYDSSYRIKEILAVAKNYYGSWDDILAMKLIKHFGLSPNQKYKKLSRGMKTQVNIIIGICARMPLTILDEPTLGLDAAVRKDFYNILLNDYIKHPRTMIISSHLLNEIEVMLEDIILIEDGQLLLNMPMEDFRNHLITLTGDRDYLAEFVHNKEVLDESTLGKSAKYTIVNHLSDDEHAALKAHGIQTQSVSSQDQFIYLTSKGALYNDF